MSTPLRALVSEAEFLALSESNQRMELVDGEVIVPPSPSYWHQELLARLFIALRAWAEETEAQVTVVQAPLDVRLGPGRIVQPDIMVFGCALAEDVATPLDQVPELCIEVLSGNRLHDRVTKRYLYAEAGVREYWVVDPAGLVERRTGPDLGEIELCEEGLGSPLLPGFALDLEQLFARR